MRKNHPNSTPQLMTIKQRLYTLSITFEATPVHLSVAHSLCTCFWAVVKSHFNQNHGFYIHACEYRRLNKVIKENSPYFVDFGTRKWRRIWVLLQGVWNRGCGHCLFLHYFCFCVFFYSIFSLLYGKIVVEWGRKMNIRVSTSSFCLRSPVFSFSFSLLLIFFLII